MDISNKSGNSVDGARQIWNFESYGNIGHKTPSLGHSCQRYKKFHQNNQIRSITIQRPKEKKIKTRDKFCRVLTGLACALLYSKLWTFRSFFAWVLPVHYPHHPSRLGHRWGQVPGWLRPGSQSPRDSVQEGGRGSGWLARKKMTAPSQRVKLMKTRTVVDWPHPGLKWKQSARNCSLFDPSLLPGWSILFFKITK